MITSTRIKGVYVIEPEVYADERGYLFESWNKKVFEQIQMKKDFVQENHLKNKRNVVRGMHFQKRYKQGKLVRCIKGKVYDVAVDLRSQSPTFGEYYGIELTEENKKMLYIPEDFAHGFLSLTDSEVIYKATDYYHPEYCSGIVWNDSTVNIDWDRYDLSGVILLERDRELPTFEEYECTVC